MEKKEYIERGLAVQLLRECTQMQGKEIEKECDMPILRNVLNVYYLAREGATTLLEDIPAADVAPVVHGEWEASKKAFSYYHYRCSVCGCDNYRHTGRDGKAEIMRYCPNCGAKMDGGNRNADA